jgi:hypothetical protein
VAADSSGSSPPAILVPAGTALVSVTGIGIALLVFRKGLFTRASKQRT